jgi:hypothetical protein
MNSTMILFNVLWLLAVVMGLAGAGMYCLNKAVDQTGR